ncbi:MAG: glycosyltransferase family 4 protein [Syntrophales bacterium]
MRVLMLGWEFPPHISGGLGTACFGITKGLTHRGVEVIFVLPRIKGERRSSHVRLISASEVPVCAKQIEEDPFVRKMDVRLIDSILKPYLGEQQYRAILSGLRLEKTERKTGGEGFYHISGEYGPNLMSEAIRYGEVVGMLARKEKFDIIHGHDWMTVFAGIHARKVSGKPYVYHAHAMEFDRSGENINQEVFEIEKYGMESADHIIAVSHYTKNMIVSRYGIRPEKISVVHNAVSRDGGAGIGPVKKKPGEKIVLFLGRITFQKGPDYFIEAASLVLRFCPDVTFVMAGTGDMMPRMIERAAELRIGKKFHFLGFVSGLEIEQIYAMSDLYVMPSVSEPFGISPLEAMLHDVPVIISKQSGVAEILRNVLKVDFWDIIELANKIIAVLSYPALSREMVERSRDALRTIHWENAAGKIISVYHALAH